MSQNAQIHVAIIAGSPKRTSRAAGLMEALKWRLLRDQLSVRTVDVSELPAESLLRADHGDPRIREATRSVEWADGVIAISPVYKASYTGAFKAFVDLLPQFGLRRKVVLPLVIGGSMAHVLAIDYALRPMLQSLDPELIVSGLFICESAIDRADGITTIAPEVASRLEALTGTFIDGLRLRSASSRVAAGFTGRGSVDMANGASEHVEP